MSFLKQYGEPYVLVGQDDVDAASVARLLAAATAYYEGSYGMLCPCHLFVSQGLALVLTSNDGQARHVVGADWQHLLIADRDAGADPEQLKQQVGAVVGRLAAGIQVGRVWPR